MKWEKKKVADVCDLFYGKSLSAQIRINGDFPVYGSAGQVGTHNQFLVEGPGIIIGRKGSVGTIYFEKKNFFPIDTSYYVVSKSDNDLRFLYYKFKTLGLDKLNSDAAVPGLNRNVAYEQSSIYPPLPTQRKIASILSAYDDLIENNLKRIRLLEEKALLEYKCLNRDNLNDKVTNIKLKDVLDLKYGKALKSDNRTGGKYPVFGSSGIVGSHENYLVEGPGIIVGRKGNVGTVFWSFDNFWTIDTAYFVESEISLYYLYFNLKEQHFLNTDAAVPGLNRNFAMDNPITIPPIAKIILFEENVKPIFKLMQTLNQQNIKLREARDILLPRLMSGEIDI